MRIMTYMATIQSDLTYMTAKELYQLLGYSHRQSFWRAFPKLVKRGLPYRRVHSRRVVFFRTEVKAWCEEQDVNRPLP